ncbi:peptidase [Fusobacterium polymorphum]|uniref:Peptidase n=1 Tax=Fusobacterium nucleatum subsp. polymorphum TaxID=76857 RepID=A0A2B7YIT7_FUSNP|nr:M48 family metallopeptidase [Fusobacterium polymorphum]PGH21215.1 peptidase [Fusobacterium polymorphum]
MKKIKNIILMLFVSLIFVSCATAPLTGRRQIKFVSDESVVQSSVAQYNQMITQLRAKNLLANNTAQGKRVAQIGKRISVAVENYLRANGMSDKLQNLNWEFNLINSKDINAFALPGGKIAFYSGILPVLETDGAIAFVMGHEIGHVIGGHHAETASSQNLAGFLMLGKKAIDGIVGGAIISDELAQQGLSLGLLKFSRTQEYEADKYGMIFMAMAGYNPEEAIRAEERMMKLEGSQNAEILSTHPSSQNRIEELRRFLPEAMKYYKK